MRGEALLLFDGECRLCRRAVRWVRAWDLARRIVCLPYQHPLVPRVLPDVPPSRLASEMLFVAPSGARHHGLDGLRRLLRLLPGGLPLRLLLSIPGVPALVRPVYRWLATHRHRLTTALPSAPAV